MTGPFGLSASCPVEQAGRVTDVELELLGALSLGWLAAHRQQLEASLA